MTVGPGAGEFEVHPPRGEFYLEIGPDCSETIVSSGQQEGVGTPFYGRYYYPGVTDIAKATRISLNPGEDRFLEIRLPRQEPKTIKLEVAGVPEGTKTQLALERRTVGNFRHTVAKATMRAGDQIGIHGLSEAEYTLTAWSVDGSSERMAVVQRFSTTNQRFSHLRLHLEPTLTLPLVVRVEGPSAIPSGWNFSMRADGRDNPEEGFSSVDGGSTSSVHGLIPGRYQVYAGAPPGWVVSKMQYGVLDAVHQIFTLDANVSTLELTLSRRFGAIKGQLSDRGGPIDNAMIVLVPEPMPENAYVNSFPWTHLDEGGHYEFRNVPLGRYRVIAFYNETLRSYHDLAAIREHAKGYLEVNVVSDKTSIANFAQ
jgi:hypothetical protein